MLSIGLTGGVATGKSEALKAFGASGAKTLSSDAIVKDLMKPRTAVVRKIRAHFGPGAVTPGGAVCREYLRERILADAAELDWLERALHPGVRKEIRAFVAKYRRASGALVVEVPLLFENGFDRLFDRTVAVRSTPEQSEARAAKRGMSAELYHFLSKRQWTQSRKAKAADLVIHNTGTLTQLRSSIDDAFKKLTHVASTEGERGKGSFPSFAASAAPARKRALSAKRRSKRT
ncbi:MAG: dephospho-CoA kinase [Candidatus Omnitrophica bacterium]|jgi:dephospho-CoA kinase|nr:dephospho-CoA kinase [Candidatus Omnitrophota bacterium]